MQFNAVVETNISAFERMARELAPYVDRCIFSFVEMYKKLETNMSETILMNDEDKIRLAEGMGKLLQSTDSFCKPAAQTAIIPALAFII